MERVSLDLHTAKMAFEERNLLLFHDHNLALGSHIPFYGRLEQTVREWGLGLGMYVYQVFLGPQRAYHRTKISEEDILSTRALMDHWPGHLFTHAPVIYNLAGSIKEKALGWTGNIKVNQTLQTQIDNLSYEMEVMTRANLPGRGGVVVHPGSFPGRTEGLKAVSASLDRLEGEGRLLLENCAGEGSKLGRNLEELQSMIAGTRHRDQVGICLDTAHLYGAGLYDLAQVSEVDRLFTEVEAKIGLNKLWLIHLNDSEIAEGKNNAFFGSKKDRHARIGQGHIWKDDYSSLFRLFQKAEEHQVPLCLETTPLDIHSLGILREKLSSTIDGSVFASL